MPFQDLPPELTGKGFWAFLATCFTLGATVLVGFINGRSRQKMAERDDITLRENQFITHLQTEMVRMQEQVATMEANYESDRRSWVTERQLYREKITSLEAEVAMLKQRMTTEEGR